MAHCLMSIQLLKNVKIKLEISGKVLQITEDSLDKSMKTFNIDASMKNELLNLYKVLSPFNEVPETLKKLKEKNLKLAILSNGTPLLLSQLVKSNNIDNLFDDLFSIIFSG